MSIGKSNASDIPPIENGTAAEPDPQIVLLVHGTGFPSACDSGTQCGRGPQISAAILINASAHSQNALAPVRFSIVREQQ